ncbi:hypothetical protein [Yoonia sp.]|uniref:hypothetical protein n=1 Tax=Yoonia sp. TaxID=2212373 RepID=UPI003974CA24
MDHLKVFIMGMVAVTSMSFANASYANGNDCNGLIVDGDLHVAAIDKFSDQDGFVKCLKRSGNNGWGNGDQDAPGGSLENNNAENDTDGQCHENEKHGCASTD